MSFRQVLENSKLRRFWRNWKTPVLVALALLVLWLIRQPVLTWAAGWRAEIAAREAVELIENGDWKAAEEKARRALQLDRSNHSALGSLVKASVQNRDKEALRVAAAFFSHPESSATDKAMVLGLLLTVRDYIGFRRLHNSLPPQFHADPNVQLQSIRFQALQGDVNGAIQRLENRTETSGQLDRAFELLHADLLMTRGDLGRAVETIARLVAENTEESLPAFRLLGRVPFEAGATLELDGIITAVASRSDLSETDELLLAGIRMSRANTPAEADEILTRTTEQFFSGNPEAVSRWLDNIGREEFLETVITPEIARKSELVAALHLKSLMTSGRFEDATEWMEQVGSIFDTVRENATNAVIAINLDDRSKGLVFWRNAMHEASIRDDGNLFLKMSRIAMEFGAPDWATEAMMEASKRPGTLLSAGIDHSGYIIYLLREDRLDDAIELGRYWLAREPESPALRNNLLYLELLRGTTTDAVLDQSRRLHETFPGTMGFQTTHALALALSGNVEAARGVLNKAVLDWSKAGGADLAIREGVLNGAVSPSNLAKLTPPERRVLESGFTSGAL